MAKQKDNPLYRGTINAARALLKKHDGINDPNMDDATIEKAAKVKGHWRSATSAAKQAYKAGDNKYGYKA